MQTQHVARCVMELSLYRREFIDITSSSIAAGSLILARTIVGKPRKFIDESQSSIYVAELLDNFLGEHLDQLSEIISAKYAPHYYSRASIIVREWYLSGRRFYFYAPLLSPYIHSTPPPTPPFSITSQDNLNSPASSTISSDDDLPLTPYSQPANIPIAINNNNNKKPSLPFSECKENRVLPKPNPTTVQSTHYPSLQISNKQIVQ